MTSDDDYLQTYQTLSYSQFPDVVEDFFQDANPLQPKDAFESEFGDLFDEKSDELVDRVSSSSVSRKESQLLGTLATLLWYRREHEIDVTDRSQMRVLRFDVATLPNSDSVFIEYPGKKASEVGHWLGPFSLDFAVKLDSWSNKNGGQTPRHTEVFSDVYWKVKEARTTTGSDGAVTALRDAVREIYEGRCPSTVASECSENVEFGVGNRIEPLLHALFWIAIQEDFNYPGGQGRKMSKFILDEITALSEADFTETRETFPDAVSIDDFPEYHSIITHERVQGFDPSERGELLSVSEVTQSEYGV